MIIAKNFLLYNSEVALTENLQQDFFPFIAKLRNSCYYE